jgi:hypothetical protein
VLGRGCPPHPAVDGAPRARECYQARMTKVGPEAAAARVLDPEGRPHALEELWAERPVVLAFVRHFG